MSRNPYEPTPDTGDTPRALCAGQWDLFDSTEPATHEEAKQLCAHCPIAANCTDLARNLRDSIYGAGLVGTWGGKLYGGARTYVDSGYRAPCGTLRGLNGHHRRGEPACEECRTAGRKYRAEQKAARATTDDSN